MSIQSPVGTLDIKNATLRVGKLEVSNIQGIDTALNVTRSNAVLIYDDQVSTTTFSGFTSTPGVRDTVNGYLDLAEGYVYWGQKLPNYWVMEFEMDIRSGTNAGPLYANIFSTTNTGGDGYSFMFNDSNDKITLKYDGTTLAETTVSGLFTASEDWQKVVINYERGLIAINVGGTRHFYYKDIERETPYTNGEYVNFSSASTDGRKIRNLKITNGSKWIYSGESNVIYNQGSVGINVTDPTTTLDVGGTVKALTFVGDGSAITNINSSNIGDFASNVQRITNLETDLSSNATRVSTLETDLSSNATRVSTLETDLSSNATRVSTLETDLSSNAGRITNLESGNITISGQKSFSDDVTFQSNIHVKGDLLVANTVNMVVSDPIIELGSNNLNTGDLGIVMTRHGASNSNVAIVYDESADVLRMGYTLGGANDTTIELDSNLLAVSIQGNVEVGTANLFVDTVNSRIGVGTTSPTSTLEVGNSTFPTSGAASGSITLSGTGSTKMNLSRPGIYHRANVGLGLSSDSDVSIEVAGDTGTPLEAMRIKRSSNVGIGTTSPAHKLDVNGNIGISGRAIFPVLRWDVDLTAQSTANFYPVEFVHEYGTNGDLLPVNFKVYGKTLGGGNSFNENTLVGFARGGGYSDHNGMYDVQISRFTTTEHRFLGIYEGTRGYTSGFVIYMRGGYTYGIVADALSVTKYTTAYDTTGTDNSIFAIKNGAGTDVSGTSSNISELVNLTRAASNERFIQGDLIVKDGNVGIGTTSPAAKLHINTGGTEGATFARYETTGIGYGGIEFRGTRGTGSNGSTIGQISSYWQNNTRGSITFNDGGDINILPTRNVGIGTASPGNILTVGGGGRLRIANGNSDYSIIGTNDIDGTTNTRIVLSGINRGLNNGGIDYVLGQATSSQSDHIFHTAGAASVAMRIKGDTGNVGIGTSSPGAKLHINHDFHIQASSDSWNSAVGKGIFMRYATTGTQDEAYIQSIDRSTGTTYPLIFEASRHEFKTGNVGIGTATPQDLFHMYGASDSTLRLETNTGQAQLLLRAGSSVRRACRIDFSRADTGTQYAWIIGDYQQNATDDLTLGTSGGGRIITLTQGGNTGIGTTGPNAKLAVSYTQGTLSSYVYTTTSTWYNKGLGLLGGGGGFLYGHDINHSIFLRQSPFSTNDHNAYCNYGYHAFYTGGYIESQTEKMRITDSTTASVAGGTSGKGVLFAHAGIAIDRVWANYPSITVMNVSGTSETNQGQLRIHGCNVSYSSYPNISGSDFACSVYIDGTYQTSSDRRIKTNITTIDNALDKVMSMTGKRYQLLNYDGQIRTGVSTNNYKYGFIAQEIEEAGLEELYLHYEDEDDGTDGINKSYSLDYDSIVPILVNAIKEQQTQINEMKREIETLKNV